MKIQYLKYKNLYLTISLWDYYETNLQGTNIQKLDMIC